MLSFFLFLACDDPTTTKESDSKEVTLETDGDNDGYVSLEDGGNDCDDSNAAINPAAQEVCDDLGVDENCDGEVLPPDTYYGDGDRDGYGDSNSTTQSCQTPPDSAFVGGDCDDTNALVNPSAQEVCDPDDIDEDCDGLADDGDDSVDGSTQFNFFPDTDLDGYGSEDAVVRACDVGEGSATNTEDCDDTDPNISPVGTETDCDGIDQDCSGADSCELIMYTSNLQNATVLQPVGLGSILVAYMPDDLLLLAQDQGATMNLVAMDGNGYHQPSCDLGTFPVDWSAAPAFSGGPMDVTVAGLSAEGLTMEGVFASDMSGFKDGHGLWEQDVRGMESLVGFPPDEICNLLESFGTSCHACADGLDFCVTMELSNIEGTRVANTASETGVDCVSCSSVPFATAWGSAAIGLVLAGLRRRGK